jgi:putative endonuclease
LKRSRVAAYRHGLRAEIAAASLLLAKGYRILARRYKTPLGEIDLIVKRGRLVAFVEVKCRSGPRYGSPAEAVTRAKRRDLACAAAGWIARHARPGDEFRFDLIAVTGRAERPSLAHFEDAWRL